MQDLQYLQNNLNILDDYKKLNNITNNLNIIKDLLKLIMNKTDNNISKLLNLKNDKNDKNDKINLNINIINLNINDINNIINNINNLYVNNNILFDNINDDNYKNFLYDYDLKLKNIDYIIKKIILLIYTINKNIILFIDQVNNIK